MSRRRQDLHSTCLLNGGHVCDLCELIEKGRGCLVAGRVGRLALKSVSHTPAQSNFAMAANQARCALPRRLDKMAGRNRGFAAAAAEGMTRSRVRVSA
jgi:hypothetical protein